MPSKKTSVPKKEAETTPVYDPFDPAMLRLSGKDRDGIGIESTLVELQCRKPKRQEWVRTNPDCGDVFALLKLEDTGEFYLVPPEYHLHSELLDMIRPYHIQWTINRQGATFLWPVAVESGDGAGNSWSASARKCQIMAEEQWVSPRSDKVAGAYVAKTSKTALSDPEWPDSDMRTLLQLCFSARIIDSADHQVIKMLAGEV